MKQSNQYFDILIVGGGAAGLAAAIEAGMQGASSIAVAEKRDVPGKKLSATGNGRCNLSNIKCENRLAVEDFFHKVGILTRIDGEGRLYPYSEEAGQVVGLLVERAKQFHTEFMTNCQVLWIKKEAPVSAAESGGFIVGVKAQSGQRVIRSKKVLLAAGGKSYSIFGTAGEGYPMAKSFGHEITRLAPSLVPIEVAEDLRQIAGVRAKAKVSLWRLGRLIAEEMGELQLNKDCLSGICIMNLSRLLVLTEGKPISEAFCEYEIRVDLFPEMTLEQLNTLLSDRVHLTESLLRSMVKEKLAAYLLNQTKHMSEKERIPFLCRLIKDLRFHVTGTKGWNDAQVTRGGVSLSEIDEDTMESKLQKGLYFAGEITDYDGPCGGFNLHYAWLSGSKAGKAMAAALATEAEGADHRISCGDHNYV